MNPMRMEMPFPTKTDRRPNPISPGVVTRQIVDIERITEEMAVPSEVIAKKAQKAPRILDPDNRDENPGYL